MCICWIQHKFLKSFSTAAYLLYYLYTEHTTNLMSAQLYHDLQTSFKDALFTCARAKVNCPDQPLYFVLDGTDPEERFFGNVRLKYNTLEIVNAAWSMMICDEIMTVDHPEWERVEYSRGWVSTSQTQLHGKVTNWLKYKTIKDLKERICFLKDQLNKQSSVVYLVALKCNDGSYFPDLKLCVLSSIRHENVYRPFFLSVKSIPESQIFLEFF